MSQWNIYWLEWYPDRIIGGVNGKAYFEHKKEIMVIRTGLGVILRDFM